MAAAFPTPPQTGQPQLAGNSLAEMLTRAAEAAKQQNVVRSGEFHPVQGVVQPPMTPEQIRQVNEAQRQQALQQNTLSILNQLFGPRRP